MSSFIAIPIVKMPASAPATSSLCTQWNVTPRDAYFSESDLHFFWTSPTWSCVGRSRRHGDGVNWNSTPSRHLRIPAEAAKDSHNARVVEDAVYLRERAVPLLFCQRRLLSIIR